MTFDYRPLIDKAILNVLKQILTDVEQNGLFGDQSFYISFPTNAKGVMLSKAIRQKYPQEITIVLQHQFRNLKVSDEKFTVNIVFSGVEEKVEVPFNAITSFLDPIANFGFQFVALKNNAESINADTYKAKVLPSAFKFNKRKTDKKSKEAKVFMLDKFRKKRDEENNS